MKLSLAVSPILDRLHFVLLKFSITWATATIVLLATQLTFAQLNEIDTRVVQKVPLKVEFKNKESINWVHELEIEVTNLSDKPICYLYINLFLNTRTIEGQQQAFSILFGDSKRLYSNEPEILESDPVIQPSKSMTFKIEKSQVDGWKLQKTLESFVEPREAELSIGYVLYTDGSGFFSGGTRFQKKIRKTGFLKTTSYFTDKPRLAVGDFFLPSIPSTCNRPSKQTSIPELDALDLYAYSTLFRPEGGSCTTCTQGNCPSPAGYNSNPIWGRLGTAQTCQNCNEDPYREVPYHVQGSCFDNTNNQCYLVRDVPISCLAGSPPQPYTCWRQELRPCVTEGCDSSHDQDGDRYYRNFGTCQPPQGEIDCDDTDDTIHPNGTEICDDADQDDEDCDGFKNCRDGQCRQGNTTCDAECDKDEDGYVSTTCEDGDDCVDDPQGPHGLVAFAIHPGVSKLIRNVLHCNSLEMS